MTADAVYPGSGHSPRAASAQDRAEPPVLAAKLRGVGKRFGRTVALKAVDLDIPSGSFFGLVGPNGAGKTTILSILTGLTRPDTGVATVHDVDVQARPVVAKQALGVVPDNLRVFDRLTGYQYLRHLGGLRRLPGRIVGSRIGELAHAFDILPALDRLLSDCSSGMCKKIALAGALIHAPRILVLDEPFESVDQVSAVRIVDVLREYTGKGGTVVLSSHDTDLVARSCDHIAVIVGGRVVAAGSMATILRGRTLEQRFTQLARDTSMRGELDWLYDFSS